MRRILFLILLGIACILSSCGGNPVQNSPGTNDEELPPSESIVTDDTQNPEYQRRISAYRNGLSLFFIPSETGVYCLSLEKNGCFVLYCDKGSDRFEKLCSRVDCLHNNRDCDAFLSEQLAYMGYYNGKLYYIVPWQEKISQEASGKQHLDRSPLSLWQMDADGTNKKKLTDCYEKEENVVTYGGIIFTDGIVEGYFKTTNELGETETTLRYCSLEDPAIFKETAASEKVQQWEGLGANGTIYTSDKGRIIVLDILGDANLSKMENLPEYSTLYEWEPGENILRRIGQKETLINGSYGIECGYYIQNGIVMQWDYRSNEGKSLFSTGLKGKYELKAFPEFFAVSDQYDPEGETTEPYAYIRFYSRDFAYLGDCKLGFDHVGPFSNLIFGETDDRLLIVKNGASTMPDCYIEKSDFGTGNITLHEYHYPEMDLLD